jgi:hypothetical protein
MRRKKTDTDGLYALAVGEFLNPQGLREAFTQKGLYAPKPQEMKGMWQIPNFPCLAAHFLSDKQNMQSGRRVFFQKSVDIVERNGLKQHRLLCGLCTQGGQGSGVKEGGPIGEPFFLQTHLSACRVLAGKVAKARTSSSMKA